MNVCGGTPYANVFRGSNRRAARLDLSNPSLTVDLKKLMLEAMTSSMSTWKRPLEIRNINLNSTPSNGVSPM
jgi:hypothetical protein